MTQIYPTIRTMTWNEAHEFGHFHQGLMMEHNCVSYRLTAGTKDNLHVLESGPILYVLTLNTSLDYIGLDVYMPNEGDAIDSIFLQGDAINECIGKDWRSLSLTQLVKRLARLFMYSKPT